MVIECTECHTRFKLADDKLKPGGIKVRCSKCKHIFTAMPPVPTPPLEEEIDFGGFNMERLAEPGNEPAAAPPAAPSAAADRNSVLSANADAHPVDQSTPDEMATGGGEGASQPDEFSLNAGTDSKERDTPAVYDRDKESPFGDEQTTADFDEFTFGGETETRPDESTDDLKSSDAFSFGGEEATPDEFDFGETAEPSPGAGIFSVEGSEDFPFDEEQDTGEEDSAPDEFSFDDQAATGSVEFDFGEEETGAETDTTFSWEAEKDDVSETGFEFDAGAKPSKEADEFDFSGITFGDEEPQRAVSVADEARPSQVQAQSDVISVDEMPHLREPVTAKAAAAAPPESRTMPLPFTPRRKNPFQRVMFLLGLLLFAMLGGAIYFYWQGGIPELTNLVDRLTGQTVKQQVNGQIRLEGLSSFYVRNGEVGQVLVIQGKAVNDFPEARSSLAVKGVLYNKEGKALLQQTVFCGNPLAQDAIMQLPYAKIEESMNNPFGESLSNLNVAPGKTISFTIVFRNLPADIAEFTVEAVDSKPASKQ